MPALSTWFVIDEVRVAEVGGPRDRRSTKGSSTKEGPPTYSILSRNSVLSRFTLNLPSIYLQFTPIYLTLPQFTLNCINDVFTREFANLLSTKALSDSAMVHISILPYWQPLPIELNHFRQFSFESKIELNHFRAKFDHWLNLQIIPPMASHGAHKHIAILR